MLGSQTNRLLGIASGDTSTPGSWHLKQDLHANFNFALFHRGEIVRLIPIFVKPPSSLPVTSHGAQRPDAGLRHFPSPGKIPIHAPREALGRPCATDVGKHYATFRDPSVSRGFGCLAGYSVQFATLRPIQQELSATTSHNCRSFEIQQR
jgi:hypothetical protein